jgi:hypothetical protein
MGSILNELKGRCFRNWQKVSCSVSDRSRTLILNPARLSISNQSRDNGKLFIFNLYVKDTIFEPSMFSDFGLSLDTSFPYGPWVEETLGQLTLHSSCAIKLATVEKPDEVYDIGVCSSLSMGYAYLLAGS